ncbi:MAG TPA: hypothetical protein VEW42_06105 [Candidatus Eisenbacteria bacterium]|nr:hypothetical protein [Candidatus Eisenbacteria bacterium]
MQPQSPTDYKQLLSDVIKKQIVILGPDITLSKARNVKGLTISDDGTVTNVEGEPQALTQALIDQFVQLSGLIVKKTMEPLLSLSQPGTSQSPATPAEGSEQLQQATAPKAINEPLSVPVTDNMIPQTPPATPSPASPTIPTPQETPPAQATTPSAPAPMQNPTGPLEPAKNPLAA